MKVKELFMMARKEDIVFLCFMLFDYLEIKNRKMQEVLEAKEKFSELMFERIDKMIQIEDKNTEDMVFVVKYEEESYESQGDFYYSTFSIKIEEAKNKLKNLDNERIENYAYEACSFEKIANFEVAKASVEEYGVELCCVVILNEINFYGLTDETRGKEISGLKKSLEESLEEAEKGHTISGENFLEELKQEILDNCKSDEEREYILLKREFEEKTKDFRQAYMQKMIEKNHVKIMEMIKKSF